LFHCVFALVFAAQAAVAEEAASTSKPGLSASRTVSVAAQVSAIDHATREVTIEADDGTSMTFIASDDVRNLDQVHAGDYVIAQVFQEVDIEVRANPEGLSPAAAVAEFGARAPEGAEPGVVVGQAVTVVALVTAIDLEANTFTLKGPEGNEMTFEAQNPDNLRRSEVGDLVVITVSQSFGVLVEHPGAE